MQVNSCKLPAQFHCACLSSASASALIMNNHKNSINYVPTVASCLTPPMANSIASLGRGGGGEGSGYSGCELNGMQKCKSKIIYASLLTAVAVASHQLVVAIKTWRNFLPSFSSSVCLSVRFLLHCLSHCSLFLRQNAAITVASVAAAAKWRHR